MSASNNYFPVKCIKISEITETKLVQSCFQKLNGTASIIFRKEGFPKIFSLANITEPSNNYAIIKKIILKNKN